ncbi:MAG: DUF3800 domain-containing protein [bacterium]|nr:DUF3800 domain-containing protein [bacterium]
MRTQKTQKPVINVYGDESCYLEKDKQQAMVFGAIACNQEDLPIVLKKIRFLKKKHHLKQNFEIKWTKVSASKISFYQDLIHYFFAEPALHFRGLIIPDKKKLNHQAYSQTHDQWYYKMYFETLKVLVDRQHDYHFFLDVKDTLGGQKLQKMRLVLSQASKTNSVKKIQLVRSNEVLLLQLADLLIGALSYQARNLHSSEAKNSLVDLITGNLGFPLNLSSPKKEKKFNCLVWEAS